MRTRNHLLAAAFGVAVAAALLNAQAPRSGADLFAARCSGCHALDRDKEGPRLAGVFGRAAAAVDGFQYSAALAKSKLTWNDDTLDKWLADPDKLVPDNDMAFHVDKPDDRRALIQYLKQISHQ
jgi:cytochrome c